MSTFSLMQLCDLLKSRVECADFLEKLEYAQVSAPPNNNGMHPKMVPYSTY